MQKTTKNIIGIFGLGLGLLCFANHPMPPNTLDMSQTLNIHKPIPAPTQSPVITQSQAILSPDMHNLVQPSVATHISSEIEKILANTLTPEQINTLKANEMALQRALSSPYVRTPAPVVRSIAVNLAPDSTPPVIRLSLGMIGALVFLDEAGNPWEIENIAVDGSIYRIHAQASQNRANNTVLLEPLSAFSHSNLVVLLKGKATPVIFMLTTGQNEVDIRVDARIFGTNPDSPYDPTTHNAVRNVSHLDDVLLGFLDGMQPDGAFRLVSSDTAASAWQFGDMLYVKTRLDVLYPAFTAKVSSAEGVHVYRFEKLGQNRLVSLLQRGGQPVNVRFEGSPYYAQ